jgi:hypothetical protein
MVDQLLCFLFELKDMLFELFFQNGCVCYLGSAKVDKFKVPTSIQHQILRLYNMANTLRSLWVTPFL